MYSSIWLAASLLLISAIPTAFQKPILPNPPPCVRQTPAPSQAQTEARFQDFVGAFIGPQKNITAAFEYITVDYIQHHPGVGNGSAAAWSFLSPIWNDLKIEPKQTRIEGDMSWLEYAQPRGVIVDRFRWQGGCIVEHWDEGEVFGVISGK